MRTDDSIDAHLVRYDVSFSTRALTFLYRIARVKKKDRGEKMGKKRKAANNNKGTTPKFAVHPEKK